MSLRDYQASAVERVREKIREGKRRPILVIPTGGGKCWALGTPILMADGTIKPVQDVIVGDRLASPTGGFRTVLSLAHGREEMYRITPTKGDSYVVNASHLLSLRMTPGADAIFLADGTRIAANADVVAVEAGVLARSNPTARHCLKGWRAPVEHFENEESALSVPPYILGIWLGDGTVGHPDVSKPAGAVSRAWEEWGASLGLGCREDNSGRCPSWHLSNGLRGNTKNAAREALRHVGVLNEKHIPHVYKTASVADRLQLIAGLLDTDGSISRSGYDWISASERLANEMAFVCRSVGLAAYIAPCRKGIRSTGFMGDYWRVSISGDCDRIPCRAKPAPQRLQKKRHLVHGIKLAAIGEDDYYGFEIDGDRLLMLGDFTVTHNTLCATEMIRNSLDKGKRSLFLAHRRELIKQCSNKLHDAGIDHGIIQAGFPTRPGEPVQVASIQTLYMRGVRGTAMDLPKADLIVIDECHRALAPTYAQLVAQYPDAIVLGLTATPCRGDGRGLGQTFDTIVEGPQVADLTKAGWLVPTKVYAPATPDLAGVKIKQGDYDVTQLEEKVNTDKIVGDVVTHWFRLNPDRRPTVVFAVGVAHSVHLRDEFRRAGVAAEHIDGSTPAEERDDILAQLAKGAVEVVTNCQVLTEGWDSPAVSCAVLARPTKSLGLYKQMVGRILRVHPGKDLALILDHAGAVFEHGFIDEPVKWTLSQKDRAVNPRQQARRDRKVPKLVACPECSAINWQGSPCSACGWRPRTWGRSVDVEDGELAEISADRKAKKYDWTESGKRTFYGMLLYVARERGYQQGWAAHKYREKFKGDWPPRSWNFDEPQVPDEALRSWVRSRTIAWARAREKAGRAA